MNEIERSQQIAKVMLIQLKIIKQIYLAKTIILQRHTDPDPDAVGSQTGLAEVIKHSFPSKHVYCVGSDDPDLAWIGKMDKVSDDTYKNALVIVTDCANQPRISDERYKTSKKIIKIDHHPNVDNYGDISWIDPDKSSASEMIVDLCNSSNGALKLDSKSARSLYAGIIGDTGRFMFPSASTNTFLDVAQLSKYDFSMNEVNYKECETTLGLTKLYGYLDQHLQAPAKHVIYYKVPQSLRKHYGVGENQFVSKNVPSTIKGVITWIAFRQKTDGSYKASLRSKGPAINKLAEKFGGGGHALASGGVIITKKSQVKELINDLVKITNDYVKAHQN